MNCYRFAYFASCVTCATAVSKALAVADLGPAAKAFAVADLGPAASAPPELPNASNSALLDYGRQSTKGREATSTKTRGVRQSLMRRQGVAVDVDTWSRPVASHVHMVHDRSAEGFKGTNTTNAGSDDLQPSGNATAVGSSVTSAFAPRHWRGHLLLSASSLAERMGKTSRRKVSVGGAVVLVLVLAGYTVYLYYKSWPIPRRGSIEGEGNFPVRRVPWGFPKDKESNDGHSDDSDILPGTSSAARSSPSTPTTAQSPPRSVSSARRASSASERSRVQTYKDRVKSRSPSGTSRAVSRVPNSDGISSDN